MAKVNRSQPANLKPGLWSGEFYGKVNGTIGSNVVLNDLDGSIKGISYLVIPALLTPPSSEEEHRSVVWIGGISAQAKSDSVGSLTKDHDPRLLTLTLKVSFTEINAIIALLKDRLITEFQFEAATSETDGELLVTGWSGSFAL